MDHDFDSGLYLVPSRTPEGGQVGGEDLFFKEEYAPPDSYEPGTIRSGG